MNYLKKIILTIFIIILQSCSSKVAIKKVTPKNKGCSFSQHLHHQKVCLDGIWILSEAPFGLNKKFRFKRRGFSGLMLEPILSNLEQEQLKKKIKAGDLDTATVTSVLSIQGAFQGNYLIIEQRNPTDKFPNIYRYKLYYNNKGEFRGSMYTISKVYKTRLGIPITLKREGGESNTKKDKTVTENLDF